MTERLFLDTAHGEAVGTAVRVHTQISAIEVHAAGEGASSRHRRRPVVAVGALTARSSITVEVVARSRQDKVLSAFAGNA